MRFDYRVVFIITGLLFTLSASLTAVNYFVSLDLTQSQLRNGSLPLTVDNVYTESQKQVIEPNLISSMLAHDTFMKDWLANEEDEVDKVSKYLETIQEKYQMSTTFLVSDRTKNYYTAKGFIEKVKPTFFCYLVAFILKWVVKGLIETIYHLRFKYLLEWLPFYGQLPDSLLADTAPRVFLQSL